LKQEAVQTVRNPRKSLNAEQLQSTLSEEITELQNAHLAAPAFFIGGELFVSVGLRLTAIVGFQTNFSASLTAKFSGTSTFRAGTSLRFLANQAFSMHSSAIEILDLLATAKSDTNLFYETDYVVTSQFNVWVKTMSTRCRRLSLRARLVANELIERAEPDALRLYRPQANESLYAISQRFFGTPFSWRRIAARNYLTSYVMTGAEILIIPEVTTQ
jgi:hypothetical protein